MVWKATNACAFPRRRCVCWRPRGARAVSLRSTCSGVFERQKGRKGTGELPCLFSPHGRVCYLVPFCLTAEVCRKALHAQRGNLPEIPISIRRKLAVAADFNSPRNTVRYNYLR